MHDPPDSAKKNSTKLMRFCWSLTRVWSNRQMHSYIGVASHFISDYKLHNAMLSCGRS